MYSIPLPWPDSALLLALPWPHIPSELRFPLLTAIVVIPFLLLVTLYRYEMRLVRGGTAFALLSLRLMALAVVLFLVCLQPIHSRERRTELPGRVLVIVDRSASMALADPQRDPAEKLRLAAILGLGVEAVDSLSRADIARLILSKDGVGLLDILTNKHEVELWGFDRDIRELKPEQLDQLFRRGGVGEEFTDIAAPLARVRMQSSPGKGEVLGLVLLTDGQHNSGPPPGDLARDLGRHGVPILAVALGARKPPPDAAIISVRGAAQNFYKDVEGVIDVKVKLSSLPAGEYVVELREEGNMADIVAPKYIRHDGKNRVHELAFSVTLSDVGRKTLTATVKATDPKAKEAVASNNQLSTGISVADDRAKVLLADGTARWEYHYLASALERDRLVDLKKIVFDQPRLNESLSSEAAEKAGLPATKWPKSDDALASLGCVIIGDLSPEQLPFAERQKLERFVAEAGGTLIIIAGKNSMPLAFPETTSTGEPDPLRRLLPIESPRALELEDGFRLSLTRAGEAQKFMEMESDREENAILWGGHPRPWSWAIAGTAKPGATALAGWHDPMDVKRGPTERERRNAVVVRHNYGFGRVLFVGVDATWRLRYKVGDLYHHRFWGQVIRWAAGERPLTAGNEWVRFGTVQPTYRSGEPIDLTARLAEKLGTPRPDVLAGARIIEIAPGKEKPVALVPMSRSAARPRLFDGRLTGLPPGTYAMELAIPDLADKLLTDGMPLRAVFTVMPPDSRELTDLETNYPLLDELASKSGGRVFAVEEVGELADLLVRKSNVHVERHDLKLYQSGWMIALVVLLLALEWVMRKLAGLP